MSQFCVSLCVEPQQCTSIFIKNAVHRVQRGQELRQQPSRCRLDTVTVTVLTHTHSCSRPLSDFTRFLLVQIHIEKILYIIHFTKRVRDVRPLSTNMKHEC